MPGRLASRACPGSAVCPGIVRRSLRPRFCQVTCQASLKLLVAAPPATSRNQAWKFQVSPAMAATLPEGCGMIVQVDEDVRGAEEPAVEDHAPTARPISPLRQRLPWAPPGLKTMPVWRLQTTKPNCCAGRPARSSLKSFSAIEALPTAVR